MKRTTLAALAALLFLVAAPAAAETITQLKTVPFASLPACNATTMKGQRWKVSNSNTATHGDTVAGGGAILAVVECDGTNWKVNVPGSSVGGVADNSITLAKMADDSVGIAELSATGTASGTTFLRGDNTWATPAGGGGSGDVESIAATDSPASITVTNGGGPNPTVAFSGTSNADVTIRDASPAHTLIDTDTDNDDIGTVMSSNCPTTTGDDEYCGLSISSVRAGFLNPFAAVTASTQAITIGSLNTPSITFLSDNTGTVEMAFPAGSIDGTEILDGAVGTSDVAAGVMLDAEFDSFGELISRAAITGTADATTFIRGDGTLAVPAGAALPHQSSAPTTPSAGSFAFWWDSDDDQPRAIEPDGSIRLLARRNADVTTTGAIPRWNGSEFEEGSSANCVDAGGVLTCDEYASRSTSAPAPKFHSWLTNGCGTTSGNVGLAMIVHGGSTGCQNFSAGASVDDIAIPIDDTRKSRVRTFTFLWRTVGTGAGWDADEMLELNLSGCALDTTPDLEDDCTTIDTFLIENDATPDFTYGGAGANNRTAKACSTVGGCALTWEVDGAGRATSNGNPESAAGVYDYYVVWFNVANANFTADDDDGVGADDDIVSFRGTPSLTWDN